MIHLAQIMVIIIPLTQQLSAQRWDILTSIPNVVCANFVFLELLSRVSDGLAWHTGGHTGDDQPRVGYRKRTSVEAQVFRTTT